jgi:hypothetical protein
VFYSRCIQRSRYICLKIYFVSFQSMLFIQILSLVNTIPCITNMDDSILIFVGHSICDSSITFTPTTPAVSTITAPVDSRCGDPFESACHQASDGVQNCQFSFSGTASSSIEAKINCLCQSTLLSEAFTCEYVGNVTCSDKPVATSSLYGYGLCSNFPAFFQSMLTEVSRSLPK